MCIRDRRSITNPFSASPSSATTSSSVRVCITTTSELIPRLNSLLRTREGFGCARRRTLMSSENKCSLPVNNTQDSSYPKNANACKITSYGRKSSVQSTLAPDLEIIIPTEQSFSCESVSILRTNFSGTSPSTT